MALSLIRAKKSKPRPSIRMGAARWPIRLLLLTIVVAMLLGGWAFYEERLATAAANDDAANPRANFWRTVRQGVSGETTVQGLDRGVLIQNG